MGELFKIGPVVMKIQGLKVAENHDFPKIFPFRTSAEIHAFFPSLVYGLVENKGGEKAQCF